MQINYIHRKKNKKLMDQSNKDSSAQNMVSVELFSSGLAQEIVGQLEGRSFNKFVPDWNNSRAIGLEDTSYKCLWPKVD